MTEQAAPSAPYLNLGHLTKRDVGQLVEGKGVLIAHEFQHTNPVTGKKTGGEFNYFAAPKDLIFLGNSKKQILHFGGTIVMVNLIKGLQGHNGILAASDSYLCASAKNDPSFLSHWHTPTADLMQEMVAAKRKHDLIGTFAEAGDPSRSTRYWTLSGSNDHLCLRAVVDIETGSVGYVHEETLKFSCRPVRGELAPK